MTEIEQLEGRLRDALDRIRAAAAQAPATASGDEASAAEISRLTRELEEERTANAQLEERVRAIREKQDQKVTSLETRLAEQEGEIKSLQADLDTKGDAGESEELKTMRAARAEDLRQTEALVQTLEDLVRQGGQQNA
ncbi:MAG: hypothetical protein ACU0DW_07420 [Shimia sp.]